MARILIVDDDAISGRLLAAILEQDAHSTTHAVDGADGLAMARVDLPDLIISDILMPSMDGYEFVRRLRADPMLAHIAVIFHTAHYHEREARRLALSCQVTRVLVKTCPAAEILDTVREALAGAPLKAAVIAEDFDRGHLQLLTTKLSQHTDELRAANSRLAALSELNVQLASEREPLVLLEKVCHGARGLLGSKYAVLAVSEMGSGETMMYSTSGLNISDVPIESPSVVTGPLGKVVTERRPCRIAASNGRTVETGLPKGYPPASALLAVPVSSLAHIYGWLCVADKVGADGFDADDEQVLSVLGAQVGRIYENSKLYRDLQTSEGRFRQLAEKIEHLNRVYAMLSGINSLIVRVNSRDELFTAACRLAVETGKFKSAWCGWNDASGKVTPVAWAGDAPDLAPSAAPETAADSLSETIFTNVSRLREPVICSDLAGTRTRVLDVDAMLERGHRAMVVLPLVLEGSAVGSLTLVTDEQDFFDEEEMVLLNELAGDISFALDHLEKSEKLNYLAYYDTVTGLANATFFHERLAQYVGTAERGGGKVALIIADPQHFSSVNEAFGRHLGDQVLRQVAERFSSCVGDSNAVGRISANHFAAVIEDVKHEGDVGRTVDQWWKHWLDAPFVVQGHEVRLSASAGIAMFPADGHDAAELSRHAEAALKNAKATGKKQLFYTRGLSEGIAERLALEQKLNRALENNEFVLHYQPKVDLISRELTGVEALIRWHSPEDGLVPPMKFIPVLEETGLIAQVGLWVVRQACLDRSQWLERRLKAPRVAVNVSTVQLRREDFIRTTSNILKMSGGEAGIDMEVTETLVMGDIDDSIAKLTILRDLGVHIAIDDFGTGYSSLAYLAKLPVGELKIDRSFIASMLDDSSAMTLVSTIISLAHALNLGVVAEGVETEEQAKILRLLRCDEMQGYLISKPLSFDQMTAYLGKSRK